MTRNNRFENRQTVVKGFIINTETKEFTEYEETLAYVRSVPKAVEMLKEKMQLDDNPAIVITVNELINEAPKPIKYNDGLIFELCEMAFDDENEANDYVEAHEGYTIKKLTRYEVYGMCWTFNNIDGEYRTRFVVETTPLNLTKVDQRALIVITCEEQFSNEKVLAVHDVKKRDYPCYCAITPENLTKCIVK